MNRIWFRLGAVAMLAGPLLLQGAGAYAQSAPAPSILERASEYRFQLDLHVNDAALAKMLPSGWISNAATTGPAKDSNLRMIFIDRIDVLGPENKVLGKGSARLVYLAAPVKEVNGTQNGQMILFGLTDDADATPGPFGNSIFAATQMTRNVQANGGKVTMSEDWNFVAPSGEHMQTHVVYERAAAVGAFGSASSGGGTNFYNPADPSKYQIFTTQAATDILRNVTTNPPDRVKEFSYGAGGGKIAALFDGAQKVLSWDSQPIYSRTISAP